jgi:hypothetical protein
MKTLPERTEVVVIGGGIAGVATALKLASQDISVTIIERHQLFSGSSGRNPGRMGHGFHYFDYDTAVMYLEASIAVQRQHPGFLIGQDLDFSHPLRHGRYYITKASLHSYEDIISLYQKIKQRYQELVDLDPLNMVFGHPETFIRILEPSDYEHDINPDVVVGGIESNEHLFNWPKFSAFIRSQIMASDKIRLLENVEVLDIAQRACLDSRFTLTLGQKTVDGLLLSGEMFNTNFIINSSWENIEFLNDRAGIPYLPGTRSNRLKCLLEVELPKEMLMVHSSFFCMGSFCMFSNMGDGRGMMTLADLTNMAVTSDLKLTADIQRYLDGDFDDADLEKISKDILDGVSLYIPKLRDAKILGLKFGIVQTKGNLDLTELKSSKYSLHHTRNYDGIREEQQGLISNPAMKLFYFPINAERVKTLFLAQQTRESMLRYGVDNLLYLLQSYMSQDLKKFIMIHMDVLSVLIEHFDLNEFLRFYQYFKQRLLFLGELKRYLPEAPNLFSEHDFSRDDLRILDSISEYDSEESIDIDLSCELHKVADEKMARFPRSFSFEQLSSEAGRYRYSLFEQGLRCSSYLLGSRDDSDEYSLDMVKKVPRSRSMGQLPESSHAHYDSFFEQKQNLHALTGCFASINMTVRSFGFHHGPRKSQICF